MSQEAVTGMATDARQGGHAPAFVEAANGSADVPFRRQSRACIAVIGEFNSGKTTLVNTLVGACVLPPSAVVRTACATTVAFAAKPSLSAETADRRRVPLAWDALHDGSGALPQGTRRLHVGMPLQRLKQLRVIDTPGLGFADEEGGDRRSLDACRLADIVIWCTPAVQAWKASEEQAWLSLPERVRARGVLAVTFGDAVSSPSDLDRLLARLNAEAGPYFQSIAMAQDCTSLAPTLRERSQPREQPRRAVGPRALIGLASLQLP